MSYGPFILYPSNSATCSIEVKIEKFHVLIPPKIDLKVLESPNLVSACILVFFSNS